MTAQTMFGALRRTTAVLLIVAGVLAILEWTTRPAGSDSFFSESAGPASQARFGSVHRAFPEDIDPGARYVIYLHGRIIEDEGVRPTHPQFGVYEYEAILDNLAGHGLQVIAEVRPPGANGSEYARRTAQQVRDLIAAGVPADQITVMGFSKGGGIAILTSWELQDASVRFVWLAACADWAFRLSALEPAGRVLSVHEASDELGVSCDPLFGRSDLIEAEEIRINTGELHGAFYRPISEWIDPVVAWIQRDLGPQAPTARQRQPAWAAALGYEEGELFAVHKGRFGFPYVLVVINGVALDLAFDTGNMVGLTLRLAEIESLGLRTAESWKRLSSDGRVVGTFSSFSGAKVEVWGEVWPDQQVFEFDDPDLPGLLGPQPLLGKRYTLDYESGLIAISERPLPVVVRGMESIPLVESTGNPGLILFYGSLHGRRVLIQADTGKSRGTIDPELARDLGLPENERGFQIDELSIGSHTFAIPSAKEVSLRAIDESLGDPILLGIGSDILSQIPVTVDYIGGRLLLPVAAGRGQGGPAAERGSDDPVGERRP